GILNVATRIAVEEVGDALVVQTDLCLDEFTDHGHCGVLDEHGRVDNDATLVRYREMAIAQAHAGSQLVGLSGMMDGQVAAVRAALDAA
ncbi:porphobilinogen synthase, partial [Schumannella luteola]